MANKVRTKEVNLLDNPYAMGPDAAVKGNFNPAKVFYMDDFFVNNETLQWTKSVGNGGVGAVTAAQNGIYRLTTNATAEDVAELEGINAEFYAQSGGITIETRLKVNAITTVGIAAGLANAYADANNTVIAVIGGSDAVTITTAVDLALFVFDTGADTDRWFAVSCLNGAAAQKKVCAAGIAPVNATYEVQRIDIDVLGNATFFRNGALMGYLPLAVTPTVALRPYFSIISHATGRLLDIDYVKVWASRRETATVAW